MNNYFGNIIMRPDAFCRERFRKCKSLYRKDLFGHFGCVNAVEFSNDGKWLASGGDDRRVLLWNISKATRKKIATSHQMKTEHLSNIFCTVFDNDAKHIFSAGNDEDVIRHDLSSGEAIGHYSHEEAVYCVALPSDSADLFATAGECGAVFVWDVRAPEEEQICLAMSSGSFHGVAFNPLETKLVVTANAHDGVSLYDLRHPEKPLMNYGDPGQQESAMFAKFDQFGTQILALMRRSGPILYDVRVKKRLLEFNHPEYRNICTLKSPCFIGDADQFIATGSDDFSIYLWENPSRSKAGANSDEPIMVLKGHRSIVNQIRYNHHEQTIASSGVEKVIKLWSQFKMEGCTGYIMEEDNETKRQFYSHEEYMQLIVESGEPLSHDYGMRSVDEDPRMIAFFDSLIQRVNAGWFSDESSDDESPMDEILLQLASEAAEDVRNEDTRSAPNILDLLRIFRNSRRSDESEQAGESDMSSIINRRLRQLFANEVSSLREEVRSSSESETDTTLEGQIQPESENDIRSLFQSKQTVEAPNKACVVEDSSTAMGHSSSQENTVSYNSASETLNTSDEDRPDSRKESVDRTWFCQNENGGNLKRTYDREINASNLRTSRSDNNNIVGSLGTSVTSNSENTTSSSVLSSLSGPSKGELCPNDCQLFRHQCICCNESRGKLKARWDMKGISTDTRSQRPQQNYRNRDMSRTDSSTSQSWANSSVGLTQGSSQSEDDSRIVLWTSNPGPDSLSLEPALRFAEPLDNDRKESSSCGQRPRLIPGVVKFHDANGAVSRTSMLGQTSCDSNAPPTSGTIQKHDIYRTTPLTDNMKSNRPSLVFPEKSNDDNFIPSLCRDNYQLLTTGCERKHSTDFGCVSSSCKEACNICQCSQQILSSEDMKLTARSNGIVSTDSNHEFLVKDSVDDTIGISVDDNEAPSVNELETFRNRDGCRKRKYRNRDDRS